MNQKLWSSLTATALIITSLGSTVPGYASQPVLDDEPSEANVSQEQSNGDGPAAIPAAQMDTTPATVGIPESLLDQVATVQSSTQTEPVQLDEVSKVGEYQSQEREEVADAIATIYPHSLAGRQAATLYVRNIPVLTFLESSASSRATTDTAPTASSAADALPTASSADVKVGSTQDAESSGPVVNPAAEGSAPSTPAPEPTDAVWRATAIAARVNQLYLNRIDAETLTVRWDGQRQRYVIMVGTEELVAMAPDLILPDTTSDPARDALQATNRLRRLLGNAPPLEEIVGRPTPEPPRSASQRLLSSVRARLTGIASWYGPGFHGNRSASGEVFNQHALTAAHRSLPFGTQVRVTNLNTGRSVVVRITDRGPFSRGRVIDLSAGAARVIGLINSGVAPVRLDVLGPTRTASN